MKKVFTLITALFVLSFASFSQDDSRQIKEPEKTVFKPHAFLQLQGGAAYTLLPHIYLKEWMKITVLSK